MMVLHKSHCLNRILMCQSWTTLTHYKILYRYLMNSTHPPTGLRQMTMPHNTFPYAHPTTRAKPIVRYTVTPTYVPRVPRRGTGVTVRTHVPQALINDPKGLSIQTIPSNQATPMNPSIEVIESVNQSDSTNQSNQLAELQTQMVYFQSMLTDKQFWNRKIKEATAKRNTYKKELISIPNLTLGQITVHANIKPTGIRVIYSGTHKIKITEQNGQIEINYKPGQLQIVGEIKLFDTQSNALYQGIIYFDQTPKFKLSTRPLAPVGIEFDAIVQLEMRLVYI